ncbi:MAG: large repetitive protein [Solirubrobacteraceae bacterium]|jgi:carbon monoxide dehydrogenase subunit G|nr:large repetitive protein [Solirubrobacteraceae bacterium]
MRPALIVLAAILALLVPAAGASAAPTLSIDDVSVTEGNSGQTVAKFTVTLSETSATPVTVNYATADDTAKQPGDYTQTSGQLTIAPTTTTNTILVPVHGDTLDEVDERFRVNLSSASGATISDSSGVGTIQDDDASPTLSVTNANRTEGDVGMDFTVRLSAASGRDVTVRYATADGSAVAPGDYTPTSGTLTIPAGSTSRTVRVPIREDALDEPSEAFSVNLSGASGASISDSRGIGTIADDDAAPTLAIRDAAAREGQPAGLVVALSRPSGRTITVRFTTEARSATYGVDFVPVSGVLSIPPGASSGTIFVATVADTLDEPAESFAVRLSGAGNARIARTTGTVTIADDDPPPNVAPRLGGPAVSPFAFRAARLGGPLTRRGGGLVRFTLSERATVRLRLERRALGRRIGGRCRPAARTAGTGAPCVRWAPLRGRLVRPGVPGANRLRLSGRWGGTRLTPGLYRLTAVAVDSLGARSATRRALFRIVP